MGQGAGKPGCLPSSALGLNLLLDPTTSPLTLNTLGRGQKQATGLPKYTGNSHKKKEPET